MKILCLDYGLKRIGVAASDPSGTISYPLTVFANKGLNNNLKVVEILVVEQKPEIILLGLPLDTRNYGKTETPMSQVVKEFGRNIQENLGVSVEFHDERYSSAEAEEHIKVNLGITKREKIKELVDKIAASMILNSYLNKVKQGV
ncbi:MAG: Holliday junction resolvase RuvX [Firmicutes bacterium]|nr:Holliday junction resolvase RuvX [Bacillota bacterium]